MNTSKLLQLLATAIDFATRQHASTYCVMAFDYLRLVFKKITFNFKSTMENNDNYDQPILLEIKEKTPSCGNSPTQRVKQDHDGISIVQKNLVESNKDNLERIQQRQVVAVQQHLRRQRDRPVQHIKRIAPSNPSLKSKPASRVSVLPVACIRSLAASRVSVASRSITPKAPFQNSKPVSRALSAASTRRITACRRSLSLSPTVSIQQPTRNVAPCRPNSKSKAPSRAASSSQSAVATTSIAPSPASLSSKAPFHRSLSSKAPCHRSLSSYNVATRGAATKPIVASSTRAHGQSVRNYMKMTTNSTIHSEMRCHKKAFYDMRQVKAKHQSRWLWVTVLKRNPCFNSFVNNYLIQ